MRLVAVSMNLLNGFTGLFSLGQAGFMLLGAYTYGILTIPVEQRENVYMYFDGGIVQFTVPVFVALSQPVWLQQFLHILSVCLCFA